MSGPDDEMCVKSSRLKRVFFDCYRFCNLLRGRETGENFWD